MKRAQVSIDFLILFSVLLLFFVFLFQFFLQDRFVSGVEIQVELAAREQAEHVAFLIDALYLSGEGSNTSFFVVSSLPKNTNFTLTVYDEGFVVVDYQGRGYSVLLLTRAVNQTVLVPGEHHAFYKSGVISFD